MNIKLVIELTTIAVISLSGCAGVGTDAEVGSYPDITPLSEADKAEQKAIFERTAAEYDKKFFQSPYYKEFYELETRVSGNKAILSSSPGAQVCFRTAKNRRGYFVKATAFNDALVELRATTHFDSGRYAGATLRPGQYVFPIDNLKICED